LRVATLISLYNSLAFKEMLKYETVKIGCKEKEIVYA
jgi:hypothetical protein